MVLMLKYGLLMPEMIFLYLSVRNIKYGFQNRKYQKYCSWYPESEMHRNRPGP